MSSDLVTREEYNKLLKKLTFLAKKVNVLSERVQELEKEESEHEEKESESEEEEEVWECNCGTEHPTCDVCGECNTWCCTCEDEIHPLSLVHCTKSGTDCPNY